MACGRLSGHPTPLEDVVPRCGIWFPQGLRVFLLRFGASRISRSSDLCISRGQRKAISGIEQAMRSFL